MRRFVTWMFAAFCVIAWGPASAILPDNGWYWNPAESGRGFNIEIQNNVLFMAAFVYDAQGQGMWLVTGGPMSSDHTYSGDIFQTSSGQCIGCTYGGSPQETRYGTVSVNFTSPMTATISINGVPINVQREAYGLDFSNPATPLLGEWATTEGSTDFPVYFAERITLAYAQSLSSGLTAVGQMSGDSARPAVGSYFADAGTWAILLDASTSYYRFYTFRFVGFNLVEGNVSTYLKGTSPSGSLPFVAYRIKSGALVAGQLAPGIAKAAPSAGERSASAGVSDNSQEAALQLKPVDARTLAIARMLEGALQR